MTVGKELEKLKKRSGETYGRIAEQMGFPNSSSIYYRFKSYYDTVPRADWLRKFADAIVGRGNPAISRDEVMAIAGLHASDVDDKFIEQERPAEGDASMDLDYRLAVKLLLRLSPELREKAILEAVDKASSAHRKVNGNPQNRGQTS